MTDSDGEKKISVYLKRQSGKQMAKKLGVSKINEFASTEEASYFKETSKKTTLMVARPMNCTSAIQERASASIRQWLAR